MNRHFLVFFFTLFILSCNNSTNDEAEIKSVLEKESTTYRSGDVKGHASCWYIQPYSRILVSTPDGQTFDVPPQNMITPPNNHLGDGGTFMNTNYKISIHGNDAWVSHDEISISPKGDTTLSSEMKMLEKIGGEWKIVGMSIHLRK